LCDRCFDLLFRVRCGDVLVSPAVFSERQVL